MSKAPYPPYPRFGLDQRVHHIKSEGSIGIVLDIQYNYRGKYHTYLVCFDHLVSPLWYYESELSDKVAFN